MSDPTFTEPGKAISHDHEWVMDSLRERERQRKKEREKPGGTGRPQFQIDTERTGDERVLMSGMNFSETCMRLIIKHHRT